MKFFAKEDNAVRHRNVSSQPRLSEPEIKSTYPQSSRTFLTKKQAPTPNSHVYAVIALMFTVFIAVIVLEKKLPMGLKMANENEPIYKDRFIAERAYVALKNLTLIGPRVAGSYENEVLAVNFLRDQINHIKSQANFVHDVEIDFQKSSGAFRIKFLDGMTNVYKDVQSVVVKVSSKVKSEHSLLLNCHYDTVADSPGASDDGAGCAVLLEILRQIAVSDKVLKHNIIFLFNGAEENIMQASHGFITKHRWAKEVRAFINLEACGAGGREILFQAGPKNPWMLETYAKEVPYPFASSFAQDIFDSGIIPGDTDFRIFRDFGKISGVDFAWSTNGYVYHTNFDTIDQIPLGTLQRTGDNILAFVRGITSGHQLSDIETYESDYIVFFDILGAFVVRWPEHFTLVIDFVVTAVSCYAIWRNSKWGKRNGIPTQVYMRELFRSTSIQILAWIVSLFGIIIIAVVLSLLNRTMSWYAKPFWVCFLYILPTMSISMAVIKRYGEKQHKTVNSYWVLYQLHYDATQVLWNIVLLITLIFKLRSGFLPLLWLIFAIAGNLLQRAIYRYSKGHKWLLLHVLTMGIPFLQTFYLSLGVMNMVIPIMGRSGAAINSELIMAVLCCALFGCIFSYSNQIILLARNPDIITSLPIGLSFCALALILLTPLGFPYSGTENALAPQRFIISHVDKVIYNETHHPIFRKSGIWIVDMDINSPYSVVSSVPEFEQAELVDCSKELYCGMPYYLPVLNFVWKTHWVPAPPFKVPHESRIIMQNKGFVTKTEIQMNFTLTGADHMGLMFSPYPNVKILSWSFDSEEPLKGTHKFGDRDTYFVYYSYSSPILTTQLNFTLNLQVPAFHKLKNRVLDLSVNSHFLHGENKATEYLENLVKKFPSWTTVSYWTSTIKSYKF